MKTAKIHVYENIVVYGNIALSVFRVHLFNIFTVKKALSGLGLFGLLIVKTLTNYSNCYILILF